MGWNSRYSWEKAKIRGIKRKTKSLLHAIRTSTEGFPEEAPSDCWYERLPCANDFIESRKTPSAIRRLCMQALIDRVEHLISLRPPSDKKNRVVTLIDYTHLWYSQVLVFFSEDYYRGFTSDSPPYRFFEDMPNSYSLIRGYDLHIPAGLQVRGCYEHIYEDDFEYHGKVWFIGEMD